MKTWILTKCAALAGLALASIVIAAPDAKAQEDPFIGEIITVGFNFCPRGWASADGQLLAISQNTALFSLLGTMYGGDGRTTFGLPDLRGRVTVNSGWGPGLSEYRQGAKGGSEHVQASVKGSLGAGQNVDVSKPHDNRQPYLALKKCIALVGIYPSRN